MFKGPEFAFLFIFAAAFVASLLAINELIKVGRAKGNSMDNSGLLWFIGIFMPLGPLAVGLYVTALPDRSRPMMPPAASPSSPASLPSIDSPAPEQASASASATPQQSATPEAPSNLPSL